MSEEDFWMVYFILLVPRLSGHDFELLSTSEVRYFFSHGLSFFSVVFVCMISLTISCCETLNVGLTV